MQSAPGPKVIIAMNPLPFTYFPGAQGNPILDDSGPARFASIAQQIDAHIYIANVGGPEVLIPGGDAASEAAAFGTRPSQHAQIDPADTAKLLNLGYSTSAMMETSAATLGGFANSLQDLAAKIQDDLDHSYYFTFDLTPADRDHGVPSVAFRLNNPAFKTAIVDLSPGPANDPEANAILRIASSIRQGWKQPIASSDFRISLHVDDSPSTTASKTFSP